MTVSLFTHEPEPVEREAILRGCLNEFPFVSLTVTGGCMEPALREGQSVRISSSPPRIGDIVLVKHPEGLRLHRLVWRPPLLRHGWWTKGARSQMIDPAVGRDDIFGVADARASRWKDIVAALRSLAGAIVHRMRGRSAAPA